jgi:hypothetical protein
VADLGQTLIEQVHRTLEVDDPWTTRTERSFSWIAHRLEQTVSTHRGIQDGEFVLFKLCAETAVVDSVSAPEAIVDHVLSDLNRHSFGSCYSFSASERRIYATTNIWAHQDTAGWRANTFGAYVVGQLTFAEAEADFLAERCAGTVARRAHPASGHRDRPDELLDVFGDVIAPKGQEPSLYRNAFEFEGVADALKQSERVATLGGSADGIALESSFDDYTSISILSSTYRHRLLGAGLSTCLQLPISITLEEGHRIAAMLNRRERDSGPIGGQGHFGAWCVDQGAAGGIAVSYRSFLPNILHLNGLIMDTATECISRMLWADQTMNSKPTTESAWKRLAKRFGVSGRQD